MLEPKTVLIRNGVITKAIETAGFLLMWCSDLKCPTAIQLLPIEFEEEIVGFCKLRPGLKEEISYI